MAVEVILPKVDMDMETGQISRWFAKDGDTVTKGELLFEIETDKAAMEIDAPASGILGDVTAQEGAVVPVGQTVAWIYAEGEERKAQAAPAAAPAVAVEPAVAEQPAPVIAASIVASVPASVEATGDVRATPLARRLARDAGLDLHGVEGSGPKGRVQKRDVEASLAAVNRAPSSPTQTVIAAPQAVTAPAVASTAPPAVLSAADVPAGALNAVWLRQGEAGALPIVLIHGFAADLNGWRLLLAGASLDNPVLALDLPGHGASPRYVPDNLDAIADKVEETLAAYGVGACILVAHSLGGAVASLTAARGAVDVRSLVLLSSAGLGPQINGAFLDGLVRARSEASVVPWLRQLVSNQALLSRAFINATLVQAADEELRGAQAGIAARLFADGTQTFDVRSALASLNIPVRLIFGAEDKVIPASHAQGLPGKVAVHVFTQCGHMPHLEQRDAVLRILSECSRAVR